MKPYQYQKDSWTTFLQGRKTEWVITNGLGSYGGASLIGAQTRTHQGYLIASLHSPTMRYLIFQRVSERFLCQDKTISFHTAQYRVDGNTSFANGQNYLTLMEYDGTVHYHYEADALVMDKSIALKRGENSCAISYLLENKGDSPITFIYTPSFNFREHNTNSTPDDFDFTIEEKPGQLILTSASHLEHPIFFSYSDGSCCENSSPVEEKIELQTEVDLETEGLDCHYRPFEFTIILPPRTIKKLSLLCGLTDAGRIDDTFAASVISDTRQYYTHLIEKSGYSDLFAKRLVLAADQFLSMRQSTGYTTVLAGLPWFTDWGRDTMIAFTGLTLCTKRFQEAEEILLTFSQYIKNGIVPNMFPDDNAAPLYNTVDASLWYFYAVERYLYYMKKKDTNHNGKKNPSTVCHSNQFIRAHIFPHLKEIIAAYESGTDFSIYMEEDGLIHAGSGLDQITWMDVRVGEWVVTPRHGKPVEINALWYNALKVMEMLCLQYGEDASHYTTLSELTKKSFCEKFWNKSKNCLYDVIDGDDTEEHIRPNQIYAVSLPYTMLPAEQEKLVVQTVTDKLFVGVGLRSLAIEDSEYHGIYCGALPKRDAAYHQGTAWGFLLGGFITAYHKVHRDSDESRSTLLKMLEPIQTHLSCSGCIGSLSEIFDGDAPHTPRGCYAQAWSVGEVLRAYVEDILTKES